MHNITQYFSLFLLFFVMYNFHCLKVIPERSEVIFVNDSYIERGSIFNVRRYSRKGDYVINLVFTSKATLDNTVTVDFLFYEYLHNEFRRSFPEMHFKLCDLVNKDPYIGKTLRNIGITCPLPVGKISLTNMTFNHIIPSVWPFEKGMVEITVEIGPKKAIVAKGLVVLTFKQELLKTKH